MSVRRYCVATVAGIVALVAEELLDFADELVGIGHVFVVAGAPRLGVDALLEVA